MSFDQLNNLKQYFQQRLLNSHLNPHYKLPIDGHRRAHVAIIVHCNDLDQLSLITIKRVEHPLDPWSGHIALPGGMAHREEEPLRAVLREVHEELGLSLDPTTFLGHLDCFETFGQKLNQPLLVRPEVFFMTQKIDLNSLKAQPSEVDKIMTLSLEELLNPARATYYAYKKDDVIFKLPARTLDEGVMWGLTYRIITQFFEQFAGLPSDLNGKGRIHLDQWELYPDSKTLKKHTS